LEFAAAGLALVAGLGVVEGLVLAAAGLGVVEGLGFAAAGLGLVAGLGVVEGLVLAAAGLGVVESLGFAAAGLGLVVDLGLLVLDLTFEAPGLGLAAADLGLAPGLGLVVPDLTLAADLALVLSLAFAGELGFAPPAPWLAALGFDFAALGLGLGALLSIVVLIGGNLNALCCRWALNSNNASVKYNRRLQ